MEFLFSNRFKKEYKELTEEDRRTLQNKLKILGDNPFHPSLRAKKIQGKDDIFECSVNLSIRMTWQYSGNNIFLRAVGKHDYTLKNP